MPLHAVQERRKVLRIDFRGRVELAPLASASSEPWTADSMNLSEEGVRLRLQRELSIHSHVALRLFAEPHKRPFECTGRVAWIVQRLDLRDVPPFLYDVGVHFINPSSRMREFAAALGVDLKQAGRAALKMRLEPVTLRQRTYIPRVEQEPASPRRWHLVVTVEGVPCFSRRCDSLQEAKTAWQQFHRQLGRRP